MAKTETKKGRVGKVSKAPKTVSNSKGKKLTRSTSKATKSKISKLNADIDLINEVQQLLNTSDNKEKKQIFNVQQLKEDLQTDQLALEKNKLAEKNLSQQMDLLTQMGL